MKLINFPQYEDFTDEQTKVWALPPEGNYLITGAPGTGKTVMSVWRLKKMQEFLLAILELE